MADEKRDVVMEGIEKTVKNYERGSDGKGELYITGRRREEIRKPKPRTGAARNTNNVIE